MIVPAGIYIALNLGGAGSRGWGVPMATDIAFALGILALFGDRVPIGLKVFLTALAIADDMGAVLVIALFYSSGIKVAALLVAALLLVAIMFFHRLRLRHTWFYMILATGVWASVFVSGIHATVAGVLIAMFVPVRATISPRKFMRACEEEFETLKNVDLTRDSMLHNKKQLRALSRIHFHVEEMIPPGIFLEKHLHGIQAFLILPLFALFSAGVPLNAETIGGAPAGVILGIVLGLVAGKQIGVTAISWLVVRAGWAELPEGVTWGQVWGASCLAGVGFTMSIFIAELAFTDPAIIDAAKIGILAASLIAGVIGALVLWKSLPRATAR
jgi:NhaA family Na+:H+ antiporter